MAIKSELFEGENGVPRGGKREGAGRPSGSKWLPETKRFRVEAVTHLRALVGSSRDPLSQIVDLVLRDDLDIKTRLEAASIALPYLYPRLSATTVDSRSTVVRVDGNALIEKLNARIERLIEAPVSVAVIEAVTADEVAA